MTVKTIFCEMSQFAVNNFRSLENTEMNTSQFRHLMACAVTFINFLQLQIPIRDIAQKNGFHVNNF